MLFVLIFFDQSTSSSAKSSDSGTESIASDEIEFTHDFYVYSI